MRHRSTERPPSAQRSGRLNGPHGSTYAIHMSICRVLPARRCCPRPIAAQHRRTRGEAAVGRDMPATCWKWCPSTPHTSASVALAARRPSARHILRRAIYTGRYCCANTTSSTRGIQSSPAIFPRHVHVNRTYLGPQSRSEPDAADMGELARECLVTARRDDCVPHHRLSSQTSWPISRLRTQTNTSPRRHRSYSTRESRGCNAVAMLPRHGDW